MQDMLFAGKYVPIEQFVQDDALLLLYDPGAHEAQVAADPEEAYVLTGHTVHWVALVLLLYDPAVQLSHT